MKEGAKVKFISEWDIFPHCIIKEGESGMVSKIDDDGIWIKMDTKHPNLDYWDNKVQMGQDERKINDYVEVNEE